MKTDGWNCYNYFSNQIQVMQRRQYQHFQDEQGSQMPNYPVGIPVGQPVQNNAYPIAPHQQQTTEQNFQHPQNLHYQQPSYEQAQPQIYHPQPPNQHQFMHPPAFPPAAPPLPMPQNFSYPVTLNCPSCKMTVPTIVNQQSGNTTYMWAAFLFCCVSPLCCCVPFIMDSCLDKSHYCPNCGHNIIRKHQKCFEFMGC